MTTMREMTTEQLQAIVAEADTAPFETWTQYYLAQDRARAAHEELGMRELEEKYEALFTEED